MNKLSACAAVCFVALLALGSATAQDFQGVYGGLYAGGAKGTAFVSTTTVFSPTGYFASSSIPAITTAGARELNPFGFHAGGGFGFNIEQRHFLVGVEADFGAMHLGDIVASGATYPCCAPTAFNITQRAATDWLFTLRPRIGVTHGHFLVYGTAGAAVTKLKYSEVFTDTFATAHESAASSKNSRGFTAGGGVEYKLGIGSDLHWSVKGEYLYADFGGGLFTTSNNLTAFTPPIAFPTNVFTHHADLTAHIYRLGVNYRFF